VSRALFAVTQTGTVLLKVILQPERLWGLGMFKSLDEKQTFVVMEDVFVKQQLTADQTITKRIYRKGQIIPLEKARELGLTTI
jgi:hypothetical protein